MIGVIGDANVGKSSLVNAIIGQALLPAEYKCCTSVITTISFWSQDTPVLLVKGEEDVWGKKEIRAKLKKLNDQARNSDDLPLDVSICCNPSPLLNEHADFPCDTQLKLVDLPGADEADNSVVKDCFAQALSLCHGLFIVITPDKVKSQGLEVLIKRVEEAASHLFKSKRSVTFVISKIDQLRNDTASDSEDDSAPLCSRAIRDIKVELRQFLKKRLPTYLDWVSDALIIATSVDAKHKGGYDFKELFDIIASAHKDRQERVTSRKMGVATEIHDHFKSLLNYDNYPMHAKRAIDLQKQNQTSLVTVSLVFGIASVPLGATAVMASSAVRGAYAVASLASSMLGYMLNIRRRWADGTVTLGGESIVGLAAVNAKGSAEAVRQLKERKLELRASNILDGKQYSDVLTVQVVKTCFMQMDSLHHNSVNNTYRLKPAQMIDEGVIVELPRQTPFHGSKNIEDTDKCTPDMTTGDDWLGGSDDGDGWVKFRVPVQHLIYVGEFRGMTPHGSGRMFWPSTSYEAFIGTFQDGQPVQGIFLNELGFYVGQMDFCSEHGWKTFSYQADLPEVEHTLCVMCKPPRPAMLVQNRIMQPCGHGNVCLECAAHMASRSNDVPNQCPVCRTPVESIGKY